MTEIVAAGGTIDGSRGGAETASAATRPSIPTTDSPRNESAPGPRRRRGVRGKLLATVGLSTLGAVLLCELVLRLAGISFPNYYRWDSELGSSLRPGAAGRWTREGGSFVRISSHGLRDREHAIDKPAGSYRIAVLGDSYAEAFQVDRRTLSGRKSSAGSPTALAFATAMSKCSTSAWPGTVRRRSS